jgi:zinc protease
MRLSFLALRRALLVPTWLASLIGWWLVWWGPPLAVAKESEIGNAVTWKLDNGLQVAFLHSARSPLVSVQVWYRAGSKEEPPDRRGTARLLQSLAFEGSLHVRPGDHARLVRACGGFVNAATSEDATYYQETVPAQYLDLALRLEADRMRELRLNDRVLEAHKSALAAELKRNESAGVSRGLRGFLEVAYTVHPYRWTADGRLEDLNSIKLADLKSFYDAYYVPQNALLVVVGAVEESAVRAAVQARFGPIAGGRVPSRRSAQLVEPEQKELRRKVASPGQLGLVFRGYRIPPATDEAINALQLLALVLSSGDSSLVHKQLVSIEKVALQAGGQAMVRQEPGLLILLAAYDAQTPAPKVDDALARAVATARDKLLPTAAVDRPRRQLLANFAFAIESVAGLAGHLGQSWILTGDPNHFWRDAADFEKLTPKDLQRVARAYLRDSNVTILTIPTAGEPE